MSIYINFSFDFLAQQTALILKITYMCVLCVQPIPSVETTILV